MDKGYAEAPVTSWRTTKGRQSTRWAKQSETFPGGRIIVLAVGILTLVVGAWLSRAITHSITIPISRSSSHIDLMAKGDFSIPVSPHALRGRTRWAYSPNQ